ncbi:MAG: GNAT family N-acetyltransferase [Bdellovibrionales bacterium]|nr:GNAT family N-acetyltransferase [Bdellovibrionales bacterium]
MKADESINIKDHLIMRLAKIPDIQDLLTLYFTIYGKNYPLGLGTDRETMKSIIEDKNNIWLIVFDTEKNNLCASAVFEVDTQFKIARAEGFVVHPDYQNQGLASTLLTYGSDQLLIKTKAVNSIYATTRTLSVGPQLVFIKNGYIPLGIFPNAHRLSNYETLTLMAKHRPEVLNKRIPVGEVPELLGPIFKAVEKYIKLPYKPPRLLKTVRPKPSGEYLDFEIIHAPNYVQRKFSETFTDPFDQFFPFHKPNLLLSAKNGEVDIYGYLSEADGYCALITATEPFYSMAGRLKPLMQALHDYGVSYIEILMAMDSILSLETLLDLNFLPSAIYPAMLEYKGQYMDLVLLSRSMEPLYFRGIQIEKAFMPYINQYVRLWKKMHLEVLGVFDDKY